MVSDTVHALITTALNQLPATLRTPDAARLLTAIGWQESEWRHRTQVPGGHARGFLQFEQIGVDEVFRHPASRLLAPVLLQTLHYPRVYPPVLVYHALQHNDLLAIGIARLALWRHPAALPPANDPEEAWQQYVAIWRPGAVTEGGERAVEAARRWARSWQVGLSLFP